MKKVNGIENVVNNTENSGGKQTVMSDEENYYTAVQTRAMRATTETVERLQLYRWTLNSSLISRK